MFKLKKSWEKLTQRQRKQKIREVKRHFWYLSKQMTAVDSDEPTLADMGAMTQLWSCLRETWNNFKCLVNKLAKNDWYPKEKLDAMAKEFKSWTSYLEGDQGFFKTHYPTIIESLKEDFMRITGSEATIRNAAKIGYIYGIPNNVFYWAMANPKEAKENPIESWAKAWATMVNELREADVEYWRDRRPLAYMWLEGSCSNHYENMEAEHDWADSEEGYEYNKLFEENFHQFVNCSF